MRNSISAGPLLAVRAGKPFCAAGDSVLLSLAVFAAALLVRVIGISSRPFWLDEVFTLQRVNLPPAALVHDSFLNHHMPSFFLMLSALAPLGDPQLWLRLPSAAFGAFSVMLVYLIGARIAGRMAGLFAALILCCSPTVLAFGQEARSYTLEMSLILIALSGVVRLAMDIPAASLPPADPRALRWAWASFALGSAAALDVLGDALPWLLTANLIFAALMWRSPARATLLRNVLMSDLVIAMFTMPLYVTMALTVQDNISQSFNWIPPLSAARLWYNIGAIYLMRVADSVSFELMPVATPGILMWLIDFGLIAAVVLGAWRLRRRQGLLAALALSFLVLPLATVVISIWKPLLLPRYILWSAAPFAILAGIGASLAVSVLPPRGRRLAWAAAAALLVLNLLPYYGAETKPRWDIAARLLSADLAPGDVVYLDDKGALPVLRMYLPAARATTVLKDSDGDLAHAIAAQSQGRRVWVVYGHAGQSAVKNGWPEFYQNMAPLGAPVRIQMAGNRIYITEFDATSHDVSVNCAPSSPLAVPAPAALPAPPPCP